ncbi:MAG TPA: efflux RND transporter periplasmic adaptor subunit [Candidimonas sp.]|nr:efflux RND transporter periplasmic adaptor subunit [Candidimonas sp.]
MKRLPLRRRSLALIGVLAVLGGAFVWVALRSGPMAPVAVTLMEVQSRPLAPALFGIGSVEARHTYKIGPVAAGRIKGLDVHVGDRVNAGQIVGEMDAVDLDARIRGMAAGLERARAKVVEAEERLSYVQAQARRYRQLLAARSTSEEIAAARQHDLRLAQAALTVAREELSRARADHEGAEIQKENLRLIAPVDGLVAIRHADPGTTMVAGQAVVEIIDPSALWIHARFDQATAHGLRAGLAAHIVLRSGGGKTLAGRVLRVEPMADAVTEETLAKIAFDQQPGALPPLGELAEVTIALAELAPAAVISNAGIRRVDGQTSVWQVLDGKLTLRPVTLGAGDLDGRVQVLDGLSPGDLVVAYSERALTSASRITVASSPTMESP